MLCNFEMKSWGFDVALAAFCLVFVTTNFVPSSSANSDTISIKVSPAADYLVLDGEKKDVHIIEEPERSKAIAEFREVISNSGGWGDFKSCDTVLAFDVEFGFQNRIVGGSCESTGEGARLFAICYDDHGAIGAIGLAGPISSSELIEFMARDCATPELTISAEGDVMWSHEIAWPIEELDGSAFRDQLASFRTYVSDEQNGAILQDCETILMIPAKGGATGGYAGGLCKLMKGETIEPVAICANEMVGYMKLRPLGSRIMSRKGLATYVAYYCTAS